MDALSSVRQGAGAALLAALAGACACATAPSAPAADRPADWATAITAPGLPNLYVVTPTLYRSSQPSKTGLEYISGQHPLEPGVPPVKTVLSLRTFHDDKSLAPSGPSVRYEEIRFKAWHPEDEDIVKFLRIVTTPAMQPVLVHCQHGSDRTGTMVAVYRALVQGWSKKAAVEEMTQGGYGFHPLWKDLTRYVMELDLKGIQAEVVRQGPWR